MECAQNPNKGNRGKQHFTQRSKERAGGREIDQMMGILSPSLSDHKVTIRIPLHHQTNQTSHFPIMGPGY